MSRNKLQAYIGQIEKVFNEAQEGEFVGSAQIAETISETEKICNDAWYLFSKYPGSLMTITLEYSCRIEVQHQYISKPPRFSIKPFVAHAEDVYIQGQTLIAYGEFDLRDKLASAINAIKSRGKELWERKQIAQE